MKTKVLLCYNYLATEKQFLEQLSVELNKDIIEIQLLDLSNFKNSKPFSEVIITEKNGINKILRNILNLVGGRFISDFFSTRSYSNKLLLEISKIAPDLILLGCDNTYKSNFVVPISSKLNIKTIVFPFSMCNQEEVLYAVSELGYNLELKNKFSLFFRNLFFNKWIRNIGNRSYLFPSSPHYLLQTLLRISPRDPWVICGGNSDFVFVNSEFERDYYVNSGVPSSKIRIYALDESENESVIPNLFVWSVPPDHINSGMFDSYDQMIEFHLDLFSLLEIDVQISLHPRIPKDYFLRFKLSKRIHISNEPIHILLKRCEYFIASQSATIRFALRENKHVINFCIYGLPYTEYSGLSMVSEVNTIDQFREILTLAKANRLSKNNQNVENHSYYKSSGKNLNEMLLAVVDKK